ncbi:hypothetical protein CAPTEDRAFT_124422 [Capitella teleta]|uniref:Uncharacterized protein n=1 Tax=Capitella teleta TaxID=283909 RepID=R7U2U2_CAPTE|nr:hypothetical protein CAPTEDRAFT_124422 [Capitella teleta]|eukprot:ELT97976.1 hypothetical protein CAPTEDRAFT_124422 [Capitella teleta]
MDAIKVGDLEKVRSFINEKMDLDFNGEDGYTPLICAIIHNNLNMVALLIENGADQNYRSAIGYTPIMYSIIYKNENILNLLLDSSVELHINSQVHEANALVLAIRDGNISFVRKLLAHGSDPCFSFNGKSSLEVVVDSCCENMEEILQLLIAFGADPWKCPASSDANIEDILDSARGRVGLLARQVSLYVRKILPNENVVSEIRALPLLKHRDKELLVNVDLVLAERSAKYPTI